MRKRFALALSVALASVFLAVATASAIGVTLSASPQAVTYPHSVRLTIGGFPTVPATATIFVRPAGASTFTTLTTTTTSNVTIKPKLTGAYKAVIDGTESPEVTVTVAAQLLKPKMPGSVRKSRSVTVKGSMAPVVASSAETSRVTVDFYHYETVTTKVGKGHLKKHSEWILSKVTTVSVKLDPKNRTWSTWSTKWTPSATGSWKIVVTHDDGEGGAHAPSHVTTYVSVHR